MNRQLLSTKLMKGVTTSLKCRGYIVSVQRPAPSRLLHTTSATFTHRGNAHQPSQLIFTREFSDKKDKKDTKESFSEMLKKVQKTNTAEDKEKDKDSDSDDSDSKASATGKDSPPRTPSEDKAETIDYAQVASDLLGRGQYFLHTFSSGWGETWKELVTGPPEEIKKTVSHAAVHSQKKKKKVPKEGGEEGEEEEEEEVEEVYSGSQALVMTDADKSTWEAMQDRLQDSPLIQEMLKNSRKFRKQAASTDIGQKAAEVGGSVQDKIHDAREFWETSQSPLVYKLSGAWESLTAPTEEGMAVAAIQKLDPDFILESWAAAIKGQRSEVCIRAHLEGQLKVLKPITGEGVYNKLAADIRTRKHDGVQIDTNILQMDELQVMVRLLDQEGPIILCIYMVQQINCIRNKAGEIIEGGESQVIAKYYTIAYKQVYDDEVGESDWKIVDYHLDGNDQYY